MRKTFEYETELEAPPERVFPLLCPVREREWIPGWRARVVYSQSGYAEDNALFRTHVDMGELWVTTRFEPDSFRVEYTVVIRNHAVLRLDLALIPGTGGVTRWRVRRTYTAVDWIGRWRLRRLTEDRVRREHERLARQLAYFLRHGGMLTPVR